MHDLGLEEGHGEDRTQSRHTLNPLSLSLFLPPPCFSRSDNVPLHFMMFSLFTSSPSLFLLSYLYHAVSSINLPLCVSDGVGGGPHSVSHSSSINDRLEHGATQSTPPPPHHHRRTTPRPHTRTHTHTPFQLFLPPLKTSQHFFFYLFSYSLSLPLSLPVDISPKAHHTFS